MEFGKLFSGYTRRHYGTEAVKLCSAAQMTSLVFSRGGNSDLFTCKHIYMHYVHL